MPETRNIDWSDVETWLRKLAVDLDVDTIVGVTRAGLPIAVALSALKPDLSLAVLSRRGPRGEKPARYDFDTGRRERIETLVRTLEVTSLLADAARILIVDDVATYGDTLAVARDKVLDAVPDASVSFACYAADTTRLGEARPDVLDRLAYAIDIDNSRTWVSFPWNLAPDEQAV